MQSSTWRSCSSAALGSSHPRPRAARSRRRGVAARAVRARASPAAATSVMEVTLLTPSGAALALAVVVPLLAFRLLSHRAQAVRAALRLPEPGRLARAVPIAAIVVAAALLGLAAAQPRIEWTSERAVRADAEVFVVVDTSRSMLARTNPGAPIRYDRATDAALRIRRALPEVRVGIASFTDRVLPHLFPSLDEDVFRATLLRSIGIDRPPPRGAFSTTATRLESLETIVSQRYFSPGVRNRLIVVLTDGESVPIAGARIAVSFRRPPGVRSIFVHFWDESEGVYDGAVPEPQYRPDPRARGILESAAATVGGAVFDESELDAAIGEAKKLLGSGETVREGDRRNRLALAPYL